MRWTVVAAIALAPACAWADDTVTVHVAGASYLVLQRQADDEDSWITECEGSCDRAVPMGTYRVRGGGARPSEPFALAGRDGDELEVKAHVASKARRTLGLGLLGVGIAFEAGGTALLIGGCAYDLNDLFTRHDASGFYVGGFVLAAVGAAFLAGGVAFIVANAATEVVVTPLAPRRPEEDAARPVFPAVSTAPVVGFTF